MGPRRLIRTLSEERHVTVAWEEGAVCMGKQVRMCLDDGATKMHIIDIVRGTGGQTICCVPSPTYTSRAEVSTG